MYQGVLQNGHHRSIRTVFVYEKCASVLYGQGIPFGTVPQKQLEKMRFMHPTDWLGKGKAS